MSRHIYPITLSILLVVFAIRFTKPPETSKAELPSRILEAVRCEIAMGESPPLIRLDLFNKAREEIKARGGVTPADVTEAMGNPDRLLAVVETLSEQQGIQGLRFSEILERLEPGEMKSLSKVLFKATKEGEITEYDMEKLWAAVYKIAHKPKGFWKLAWETKSIRGAFDKLNEQAIRERIELALINEGLQKGFNTVIADPTARTKFMTTLKEYRGWIDVTFASALWSSSFVLGVDPGATALAHILSYLPPYLPSFKQFIEGKLLPAEMDALRGQGLTPATQHIAERLKLRLSKSRQYSYLRKTYITVFATLFATTMYFDFVRIAESEFKTQQQAAYNQAQSVMQVYLDRAKLTPEQQGIADFESFVRFAESQGYKVDLNSPEMQAEKRKRIERFVAIHTAQKKNPDP